MARRPFNVLSLFSGIGGFDLGLRLAVPEARTVCYVEREIFATGVLAARMEETLLDPAPVWSDVTTFDGLPWSGVVDCVAAGFPCQPWSAAGKRAGTKDERWLWYDIERILREVGPEYVFLENVRGLISGGGLAHVLGSLDDLGYDAEWDVFRASDVGAPHKRERVFIVAHARSKPFSLAQPSRRTASESDAEREGADVADSESVPEREPHDEARTLAREGAWEGPRRRGDPLYVADAASDGPQGRDAPPGLQSEPSHDGPDVAYADEGGRGTTERDLLPGSGEPDAPWSGTASLGQWPPGPEDREGWERVLRDRPEVAPAVESDVRRVVDGYASRVDRLRALGNGVVPAVAALAWRTLHARLMQPEAETDI